MKIYAIASQLFLGLALLGFLGWIYGRFQGTAVIGVSYEGFLLLTNTALMFVIAIALVGLVMAHKK